MKIVLLCGGKGERLWPLSTIDKPKQFLEINNESLISRTYNQVHKYFDDIYLSTNEKYKNNKNFNHYNMIYEKEFRGTFAAVLNIALYFKYVSNEKDDSIIGVVPVDHDVNDEFYGKLIDLENKIIDSNKKYGLLGVKPYYPNTKYGYVSNNKNITFIEKPNYDQAQKLIKEGYLWNSGVLVFKIKTIYDIAKSVINFNNYEEFLANYSKIKITSFDYEILEKTNSICLEIYNGKWNDIGLIDNFIPLVSKNDEYNTNIVNLENKLIINKGIKNSIFVNTKNGILLFPKDNITYERWGYYEVLYENINDFPIKLKRLHICKNENISLQIHKFRSEFWVCKKGNGLAIKDKKIIEINEGSTLNININEIHCIKALSDMDIIEIQYGSILEEEDIVRFETEWNKIIDIIKESVR